MIQDHSIYFQRLHTANRLFVLLFVFQPVGDADDADFVGSSFFTTIVTIDVVE